MKTTLAGALACLFLALCLACSTDAPSGPARDIPASGAWSAKAPMPIEISENTVATANNKIYVLGGSTPERVDQQINYEYDIATDRWRTRAAVPSGITHSAATGLNGKIYVVGAFTQTGHGGASNLVYDYDPVNDTWRKLPSLKTARGSVGVT